MTKIKELPINDRPIERLINKGSEALSNDELLAILLKTGTNDMSAKDLGTEILKETSINNLMNIDYETLIKIKGIGPKKAAIILATIELSKRMSQKVTDLKNLEMENPLLLFNYYKELLINKKQEHFYVVYLDIRNRIIKDKLLFVGTINYSMVHPREVFKEAYLNGATSVILIHNHPSGDIFPSQNDIDITKQLMSVGMLLGVKVADHIIIGHDEYYSLYEKGDI